MAACDFLPFRFEFLFVNDGSTDGTEAVLDGLRDQDARVRYLSLSRNFGHQAALSAGLALADGDAVIMMDADLQHPPGIIPRLLECWEQGYDVVNTVRLDTSDSSLVKKLCSRCFYRVFKLLTGAPIEPGSADFRLMAREAVDALNSMPERHRFIRGLVPWLGFRQTSVTFQAAPRWAGRPKYTFGRSLRLALDGVTAFNVFPLRLATVLGVFVMAASFSYGLFTMGRQLFGGHTVTGWTALLICVHFFGGCQLATIGILSEYVGLALDQVKGRPLFIVRSECGRATASRRENGPVPRPALARAPSRTGRPSSRQHLFDLAEEGGAGE
jgi:dolichol-phosphate mannosyltransferase